MESSAVTPQAVANMQKGRMLLSSMGYEDELLEAYFSAYPSSFNDNRPIDIQLSLAVNWLVCEKNSRAGSKAPTPEAPATPIQVVNKKFQTPSPLPSSTPSSLSSSSLENPHRTLSPRSSHWQSPYSPSPSSHSMTIGDLDERPFELRLRSLVSMGFSETKSREALTRNNGDVNCCITELTVSNTKNNESSAPMDNTSSSRMQKPPCGLVTICSPQDSSKMPNRSTSPSPKSKAPPLRNVKGQNVGGKKKNPIVVSLLSSDDDDDNSDEEDNRILGEILKGTQTSSSSSSSSSTAPLRSSSSSTSTVTFTKKAGRRSQFPTSSQPAMAVTSTSLRRSLSAPVPADSKEFDFDFTKDTFILPIHPPNKAKAKKKTTTLNSKAVQQAVVPDPSPPASTGIIIGKKGSIAQEKERAKLAKRNERERVKRAREKKKQEDSKLRKKQRTRDKAETAYRSGRLWNKEVRVLIDDRLPTAFHAAISARMEEEQIELQTRRLPAAGCVHFEVIRQPDTAIDAPDKVEDRIIKRQKQRDRNDEGDSEKGCCSSSSSSCDDEWVLHHDQGLLVQEAAQFLRLHHHGILTKRMDLCSPGWRSNRHDLHHHQQQGGEGRRYGRVNVIVVGLLAELRKRRPQHQFAAAAAASANSSNGMTMIKSYQDAQAFKAELNILSHGQRRMWMLASADVLADYIHRCVKAVASLNHPQRTDAIALARCKIVRGERRTLKNSWVNFLTCINKLGTPRAEVIAREYPTLRALSDAYMSCGDDTRKAEGLLADLRKLDYQGKEDGRRIGPAISRWVYKCLTSTDPNEVVS
eukprot:jgi/Bigna1/79161/fgenesh1_pg.60_\